MYNVNSVMMLTHPLGPCKIQEEPSSMYSPAGYMGGGMLHQDTRSL